MIQKKIIKRLAFLFLFSLVLNSCDQKKSLKTKIDKAIISKNVNIFLENWHLAASEANFENYFSKMDSVSIFIGTDASEIWTKDAFITYSKPYFDKGKAWDFKTLERNIYCNNKGDFVWFDELLDTNRGSFRGSGVVEKKEGKWTIKHYVLSMPIPNDDMKEVVKVTKEKDSIFRTKFN